MAVYKHSYRGYTGELTPRWSRFLILTRYASRGIFRSRVVTALFVICFFYPLVNVAGLYLNHNTHVLSLMKVSGNHLFDIDGSFFMVFMGVQSSLAFIMTAFVGPGTIAPDLANNAMPLYFCRPLSRSEYVLGRGLAILRILSWVTLVPGLLLFFIEATLSGFGWALEHWRYAAGIVIGSTMWIVILALMALALSAWVRWKVIAGGLLLAVMAFTSGFAQAVNAVVNTKAGFYLDPAALVTSLYAKFFDVHTEMNVPTGGAILALVAMCAFCILLLSRRVRAFEVVR